MQAQIDTGGQVQAAGAERSLAKAQTESSNAPFNRACRSKGKLELSAAIDGDE
jgi:hypothetical protein